MISALFKHWSYKVFAPGTVLRRTYESFKRLLACDSRCHKLMAELESLYYQGIKEDFSKITLRYNRFSESVSGMVVNLAKMTPGSHVNLPAYYRKFDFYCRYFLAPPSLDCGRPFVLKLTDERITPELTGHKSARLAELATTLGLNVPDGFVITANSFNHLIEANELRGTINTLLSKINIENIEELSHISTQLVQLIRQAKIPSDLEQSIGEALDACVKKGDFLRLAIRSSALGEDGHCSFAGQYTSHLNVSPEDLTDSYLSVLSSKYSPEALTYRINCGLSDEEAPMAVMVLEMVDASCAGVVYTSDPTGTGPDRLSINAAHGLGDSVVSGKVIPQVYEMEKGEEPSLVSVNKAGDDTQILLSITQLQELTATSLRIEKHFNTAQDIEWAMQKDNKLIFLQSRPLQLFRKSTEREERFDPGSCTPLFTNGVSGASGMAAGKAWCCDREHPPEQIAKGSILVIQEALPSYVKILHQVAGVIAAMGSSTGHFATVCREYGIPLLLGVGDSISTISHGQGITLDADARAVYPDDTLTLVSKVPPYERERELPYYRKLRSILDFVTPLKLVDPSADDFTPESCRSLHDIIRYAHEMAVQEMFSLSGDHGGGRRIKKRLQTDLPFDIFLVDIGGGLEQDTSEFDTVPFSQVKSIPFHALWKGLSHPDIIWGDKKYYNWKDYDQQAMSDAFAFQSSCDSASYAVLGKDYLNINIRFGYHFTVVDSLCTAEPTANYCSLRFAGGGGGYEGRELRIFFLTSVLGQLGFDVESKGELLDARLSNISEADLIERITVLGRLLGVTKQMDMHLRDKSMVEEQLKKFFQMV